MTRNRKCKTTRGTVEESKLKEAVLQVVNEGVSSRRVAENMNINRTTLQRYVNKYKEASEEQRLTMRFAPNYKARLVFSAAMEIELKKYLIECAKMHHGLSRKQVMRLAYEMALVNQIKCPVTWHTQKQAGIDWYYDFMARWPELSLCTPGGTNLAGSTNYNWHTVSLSFDNLEKAYEQLGGNLSPARIYNLDESGLTGVHNPPKIIAPKGKKQVEQVTSGEHGISVTACCFISASGGSIPPYLITPRVNFKPHMLCDAPVESAGNANLSTWVNGTIFLDVLQHFQRHANASVDDKVLLILDNHEYRITIDSLNFCKENGIVLLTPMADSETGPKVRILDTIDLPVDFEAAATMNYVAIGQDLPVLREIPFNGQLSDPALPVQSSSRNNFDSGTTKIARIAPKSTEIISRAGEKEANGRPRKRKLSAILTDRPIKIESAGNY